MEGLNKLLCFSTYLSFHFWYICLTRTYFRILWYFGSDWETDDDYSMLQQCGHYSITLLEKFLYYYTCLLLPSLAFLHHKNQFTKPWFIWKKGSRTLESPSCFMKISWVDISFSLKFQRGDNFLAQNSLLHLCMNVMQV